VIQRRNIAIYLVDASNEFDGIGEVEANIAKGLAARARELKEKENIQMYFLVDKTQTGKYGEDVQYIVVNDWLKTMVNTPLLNQVARWQLPHFNLVHITHQNPKFHRPFGDHTLVTFHDVNFFHNNNTSAASFRRKVKRMQRMLHSATHLSFISRFTSQDVQQHFMVTQPHRVVMNGVSDLSALTCPNPIHVPNNYLLHLSDMCDKKNTHLLVEMMQHLPDEHLVLAGRVKPKDKERLNSIINKLHLTNVQFTGGVSREQKAELYRHCKAFLFPSRSEGFGLPPLEAMSFGKPTFLTPLTSLPEVGGEAAFYFDQLQPYEMAHTVTLGLKKYGEDTLRWGETIKAQARKFTWETAVEAYIRYYIDILSMT